jgi:Tfp pilus assembly protein PilV
MAEDLMPTPNLRRAHATQVGFSMVEMLMTAFILAIGLLGLALLQTMALRVSRGNTSVTTAVLVADQIMDQVEMEGRLTWLNVSDSNYTNPSTAALGLKYLNVPSLTEYFNASGGSVTGGDPTTFFTANTVLTPQTASTVGAVSLVTVTVTFSDTVNASNAPVPRSVYLARRILHG